MTPQPPVYPPPPNGFGGSAFPGILSDEEMRERAAAYAQRVYEQQLATYKAQREQALALREEYERQRRAYQEACRQYCEQRRSAGQSVLQVDPDTGEQTVPLPPPPPPFAGMFPQAPAGVPAAERAPTFPQELRTSLPPQTIEENAPAAPTFPQESPFPQEEISDESVPAPDAEAFGETPPPLTPTEKFPQQALPPPRGFPWLSATAIALLAACAAAVGYILCAGDPRFESEREDLVSFFEKLTGGGAGAEASGD